MLRSRRCSRAGESRGGGGSGAAASAPGWEVGSPPTAATECTPQERLPGVAVGGRPADGRANPHADGPANHEVAAKDRRRVDIQHEDAVGEGRGEPRGSARATVAPFRARRFPREGCATGTPAHVLVQRLGEGIAALNLLDTPSPSRKLKSNRIIIYIENCVLFLSVFMFCVIRFNPPTLGQSVRTGMRGFTLLP